VVDFGKGEVPRVIADLSNKEKITPASFFGFGYNYSVPTDKWNITDLSADYVYVGARTIDFEIPGTLGVISDLDTWKANAQKDRHYPLIEAGDFIKTGEVHAALNFVEAEDTDVFNPAFLDALSDASRTVLLLKTQNTHRVAAMRRAFIELINTQCDIPVVICQTYANHTREEVQLYASTDTGALFVDGLGDGIWLRAPGLDLQGLNALSFGILQATRTRISKTEYISCPSCGRTLFDLQETTAKIRSRTSHLKGVKIGIMGCIVNGPGEMADADYGYVGTGPGKITLYKEKEVVKRNVPSAEAVDELIELIREHGDWIEPAEA
ncbi:MAG: flavodoxin-dependent (E)-4-hydroxy-3-methylbut-2-enyl-diphosphate synthase, partial [Flavobacteriales bacterium]|nr:flavodoxin-dependent (E)-4-hydroxy-3-methylbut-2-enyl-diphosphate synthase [Flavobacteriales bacterium]